MSQLIMGTKVFTKFADSGYSYENLFASWPPTVVTFFPCVYIYYTWYTGSCSSNNLIVLRFLVVVGIYVYK